ncbi:RNA-directed DNA polymerase from mobile element jockey, partial [Eufriesea mexicana]
NANGLAQHKEELKIFLSTNLIDILLVSETHFTEKTYFKIPQYRLHHTNHPDNTAHAGTNWEQMPNRTFLSKEESVAPGRNPSKNRLTLMPNRTFLSKEESVAPGRNPSKNRLTLNMPKELATIKLKKSEAISRSLSRILPAKWKVKNDIYLLSTKHEKIEVMEVEKKRRKNNITVTKLNIVLEYNDGMGGVDHRANYLSSFLLMRKYIKVIEKYSFT